MSAPKAADIKKGIAVIWENLQCPICLDLMSKPISTRCDHQFCKFCMMKLLDRSKRKETNCPICKMKVTKRSLQESPGFQKLVEGLQRLVQSYEFDTCTNYFTGMAQKRQGASIETESRDQMCSGESTVSEGDVLEKGVSLTSTTAAKHAFAKLMCLEDSGAASSEQDLLQESVKKDDPRTEEENKTQACPDGGSDDGTPKSWCRSSRKSKRICLDPERIVNKRQKKSVEIVSAWLLRNSPASTTQTEVDKEDVFPCTADSDTEKESTGSPATEKVIVKDNDKAGRGLEEQVFGAVYKRERRGSKAKVTNAFSAVKEIAPDPRPVLLVEKEEKIKPKRTSGHKLTPADFIKKPSCNLNEERNVHEQEDAEAVRDAEEGNGPEHLAPSAPPNEQTVTVSCPDENQNDKVETTEESPAFEVPPKRPGRRSKTKMQDVWQDVDHKLTEQINDNKKDRKRRVARNLEQTKNAKYAKSLLLVSTGNETAKDLAQKTNPNPKLVETEVIIESYPSSSEPKSPVVRKTRRSLRLQEFTAEVRGAPKRRRSKLAFPKPADECDRLAQTNTDHEESERRVDSSEKMSAVLRKNGCICNDDVEKIEAALSSEEAPAGTCEGNVEQPSVSIVPDTEDQNVCSETVLNTPSPLAALVPDSALPEKRQESPSTAAVPPFIEASVPEQKGTGEEWDTNESELDTEQLMKTFKATKRKSFYLGSPRSAQSETSKKTLKEKEQEDKKQAEEAENLQPPGQSQNCLGNQVSRGSPLQSQSPALQKEYSGTSVSSALSPNKVVESQGSRLPPNSCLLFSNTITQEALQICGSTVTMKSTESPKCLGELSNISKEDQGFVSQVELDSVSDKICGLPSGTNSGVLCNVDSSVTPDGLVAHDVGSQTVELATDQSLIRAETDLEENLSQPCLRRNRKAQRLDSSDSESSNEEDLPSMAQIFRYQNVPSRSDRDQEQKSNVLNEQEPALDPLSSNPPPEASSSHLSQSVSPNEKQENPAPAQDSDPNAPCRDPWITSSQGSVDLFGTPEECEDEDPVDRVCVDAGLSIDSTQYSNDILNTQQKEEMQQELRRLEKMMALVSEALQKKECESEGKNETEENDESSAGRQCSVTDQEKTTAAQEETLMNKCRSEIDSRKMELVASGLSSSELKMVKKLAKKLQGCVSHQVTLSTTHIVMKTNEDLVCERTLKYFQGIAGRKWVVSFLWISECFKQGKVLDESPFEVCGDVVNGPDHNGPRKARTTPENKLLMKGCEICFQGSFTDMTTDQMETMVEMCGATVVKDPLRFSKQGNRYHLVVVQPGSDDSQSYYMALQKKATVVTRRWLLDSVATYTLQNPKDYKP